MVTERVQLERYAKQSERRVRSGARLVAVLVAVAAASALLDSWPMAKLAAILAAFFVVVTIAEFANGLRRRAQASRLTP